MKVYILIETGYDDHSGDFNYCLGVYSTFEEATKELDKEVEQVKTYYSHYILEGDDTEVLIHDNINKTRLIIYTREVK